MKKYIILACVISLTSAMYCQKSKQTIKSQIVFHAPTNSEELVDITTMRSQSADSIYTVVEQMPKFPGGEGEMLRYINENIKYPKISNESGIQSRVTIRFYVDTDGSLKDIHTIRGIESSLDSVYIQLVKDMPKWTPGKHNGKAVPVYYTLPIFIHLK